MSRVTSKGQVTIPKKIRDYLGLKPGSEVEFTVGNNGQIVIRQRDGQGPAEQRKRFARALEQLRGSAGPGMSTDELMRLTRGWGEPDYDVK
jgi:antitoxin PrlF